jgi:dipeptidyl aminopeptidase/acylaminoacyl peptidase
MPGTGPTLLARSAALVLDSPRRISRYHARYERSRRTPFDLTKEQGLMSTVQSVDDPERFEHRFVTTNGIRLHYVEEGEGPLVLLIHGFPYIWYAWRHQIRALADAGYRAVAPDLRGFGQSDAPPMWPNTTASGSSATSSA